MADPTGSGLPQIARIALPVDPALSEACQALEELLLALSDDVEGALLAAQVAARLSFVTEPGRSTTCQARAGRRHLAPLVFPVLTLDEVRSLALVAAESVATDANPTIQEVLEDVAANACLAGTRTRGAATLAMRRTIARAAALIQTDHGGDIAALDRVHRRSSPVNIDPVVELTPSETAAYERILDRCNAIWRPGLPLSNFHYPSQPHQQ